MVDLVRSERELIDDVRRGDEQAFDLLMRRHSDAVRSLIAHYFRNRSMVDDLAQETFVKAYFSLGGFRADCPFVFWLKKIAVRLCIDEMRRLRTVPDPQVEDGERPDLSLGVEITETRIEARLLLEQMLARLTPEERMILLLLDGEGYDVKEVALLTGLSRTNVKVQAFRIRRRLRALYSGAGSERRG